MKTTDVKTINPIIQTLGDDGDECMSNLSGNRHMHDIVQTRYSRRNILQGSLHVAALGFFGGALAACGGGKKHYPMPFPGKPGKPGSPASLLGFNAISVSDQDTVVVPEGYSVRTMVPWGQPITGDYPDYHLDNTGDDQGNQIGSHHDGLHFFPIDGKDPYKGSSDDGLLVMNHEYVEPRFMHARAVGMELSSSQVPVNADGSRDADEVLKEMNGHGVSVVRVQKREQADGGIVWDAVADDLNRRITALTPMEIAGPVRGTDFVKTCYSPDGKMTRGTLNNCAHGVTPWNTYLAAEENWAGYFRNSTATADELPREQSRYGVRHSGQTSRYGWELADESPEANQQRFARFDAGCLADDATGDYRNEPNAFGWVVEIDPFNPDSTPVKRTSLGRFAHEGVVFNLAREGKPVVCYSGDDAQDEYIYKFVSAEPYFAHSAGGHLLDDGTLYVGRFNDDGSGEWLPLVHGKGPLTAKNGFASQADVLVNTRLAADLQGATPMDRPEWGAVHPQDGTVYFALTNNSGRTEPDAANPRIKNRWGHIIRWSEAKGKAAATRFTWDLFVLAGPTDDSNLNGKPLDNNQIFNSPDGLWFDPDGRLWIQTDISESVMNAGDFAQFGNNQMLCCDPEKGDLRRFLTGPIGQEITGVITTPDQRTMFVNVQHPGATTTPTDFAAGKLSGTFPDHSDNYPRSVTLVITKDDGGIIGS